MAGALANATIRVHRQVTSATGTDALERTRSDRELPGRRCCVWQMSEATAASLFGPHQVEAWNVRFVSAEDVLPGSIVEIMRDGRGATWDEYRVQTARRIGQQLLVRVTRV